MSEGFPIEGLRGSPSSVKGISEMGSRCRRMPENELLCWAVLERLQFLHDSVAPLDAKDPIKLKYMDVVVRSVSLMRRKALLLRLASSETLITTIHELQLKLSDVGKALGLQVKPEMIKWEKQWDADRAEQYGKLNQLVTGASERMLVNEFRGDKKVQEALMSLNAGMKWKGQSPEILELKQKTFTRVSTYLNQEGLRMFDWFIPIDDVEYEDEAIGDRGTFGDVSRGTWVHDGERTEVVVKRLFPETSSDSDDAFLRQLELWCELPEHENILKLYGGSHVSKPQFYVCENAHNGNLADFLEDDDHEKMFWRLFKHVALGLKFLHGRKTIHGGLKCNNILVGANYTAKLADFGFSTVRSLSAGLSANADKANAMSIRWKPKEVLEETGMGALHFESDIYSLGMCMIEAKSHEVPFGMDDAMDKIMKGERHPRVDGVSDEEWAFISRLCDPDYTKRPSIDEVLKEISVFADAEEKQHPVSFPSIDWEITTLSGYTQRPSIDQVPKQISFPATMQPNYTQRRIDEVPKRISSYTDAEENQNPTSVPVTTLPGSPLSRHVLVTTLTQRFRIMPEWNVFSGSLHSRLNDCHDAVATHDQQWRAKYCDLLKSFIKLLRQKTLLERLAGGETFASTFKELNVKLDDICVGVERNDIAGKAHWMEDWERGCGFQAETLRQLVSEAAPRMLIGEIRGEKLVTKIMLDLFMWPEVNKSGRLRELKQQTFERLLTFLGLETRSLHPKR